MFQNLSDTIVWLGVKEPAESIVVAYYGGRFDFQFLFRDYLMNERLVNLKKPKNPLLKGLRL